MKRVPINAIHIEAPPCCKVEPETAAVPGLPHSDGQQGLITLISLASFTALHGTDELPLPWFKQPEELIHLLVPQPLPQMLEEEPPRDVLAVLGRHDIRELEVEDRSDTRSIRVDKHVRWP